MARVDPRNRERYELPAIWEPGEDWCVCIRIPGTSDHLATLADHLEMLTWSNMYARDDTRRGAAIVARRWQSALNSAPIARCTGGLMLRQNPENPCQLEQSLDGGESWTLAFDYSLCTPNLPASSWPSDEAEADDLLWWLHQLGQYIHDNASVPAEELKAAVRDRIEDAIGSVGVGAAVDVLVDTWLGASEAEREAVLDESSWEVLRNEAVCELRAEGVYPWTSHGTWLDRLSVKIADWLNNASETLAKVLSDVAALIAGNPELAYRAARDSAVRGGAGFGWSDVYCDAFEDEGGVIVGHWRDAELVGRSLSATNWNRYRLTVRCETTGEVVGIELRNLHPTWTLTYHQDDVEQGAVHTVLSRTQSVGWEVPPGTSLAVMIARNYPPDGVWMRGYQAAPLYIPDADQYGEVLLKNSIVRAGDYRDIVLRCCWYQDVAWAFPVPVRYRLVYLKED